MGMDEAGQGLEQAGTVQSVLALAGGWNEMGFKALSNPNCSVIL